MLVYKAWCESRARFVAAAILIAAAALGFVVGESLFRSRMVAAGGSALSYATYVDIRVFASVTRALFYVLAIILGLGGLVRESALGTLGFTLALPVPRWHHVLARAVVGIGELVALAAIPVVLVPLGSLVVGRHYAIGSALAHAGPWIAYGSAVIALGIAISLVIRNQLAALAIAVVALRLLAIPMRHAPPHAAPPIPTSPAGQQLRWLVDTLRAGGAVDEPGLRAHFSDEFLAKRPPAALQDAMHALAAHLDGMAILSLTAPTPLAIELHGSAPEARFRLAIAVDATTGQITTLEVGADEGPRPGSVESAAATLAALAPQTQFLVAELDHGTCKPLHASHATDQLALASAFKLYVLLGLADAVIAGRLHWDDSVTIRDEWKSLPGGITQDDPVGTRLTVRTLAERMIAISDNTAADILLYTVGREHVEHALVATGHAAPALDIPFLGTRELFWLKMGTSLVELTRYLALDGPGRRAALDALAQHRPATDAEWTTPLRVATLEWFASSQDLCRLAATLLARAEDPAAAPLLDVLAKNPGMTPSARWSYIGFKGGSEPGVVNGTWLLRRSDDRWFFVTVGLNSDQAIDETAALGVAHGLIDLTAF